jgi:hypothetical protein
VHWSLTATHVAWAASEEPDILSIARDFLVDLSWILEVRQLVAINPPHDMYLFQCADKHPLPKKEKPVRSRQLRIV